MSNLAGLSFAMPHVEGVDDKQRKEITQMLGKLKGTWKLSYNHQVNYLIKSSSYFAKMDKMLINEVLEKDEFSTFIKIEISKEFNRQAIKRKIKLPLKCQ